MWILERHNSIHNNSLFPFYRWGNKSWRGWITHLKSLSLSVAKHGLEYKQYEDVLQGSIQNKDQECRVILWIS